MIRVLIAALVLSGLTSIAIGDDKAKSDPPASADHRVFELRTYYTNDGKLVDLHKRFRDHTCIYSRSTAPS